MPVKDLRWLNPKARFIPIYTYSAFCWKSWDFTEFPAIKPKLPSKVNMSFVPL